MAVDDILKKIKADAEGATLGLGGGRFVLRRSELQSHSGFRFSFCLMHCPVRMKRRSINRIHLKRFY